MAAVGDLGISGLTGNINASVLRTDWGKRSFLRFLSEPCVREVDPDGPSHGKIKVGDVIIAVNGRLITTEGAGEPFVDPPVGVPIDLTVRRDGVELKVTVVPAWICVETSRVYYPRWILGHKSSAAKAPPKLEITPAPSESEPPERAAAPEPPPAPPERAAPPEPSEPPASPGPGFPHPWMGIGLHCWVEGNWYSRDLRFTKPPIVFRIEPGSKAEESGLRPQDVLTHVDGIPMDTLEGTEHFVEIQPGDLVEWTVLRDGEARTIEMEAEPIPEWVEYFKKAARGPGSTGPDPNALRYSGLLGETAIEVRGAAPVNVSVDYGLGLVIIRTPDTTIRLKNREKRGDN